MKKVLLAATFVIAAFASQAQETRTNAIKINPLSLFLLTGNVSYEKAVNETQSFQLGMSYSGVTISNLKYSGLGITPEYRIYFAGQKEALNGVYAAPYLRYQNFKFKSKETAEKTSFNSFGGGAVIGWQKMWESSFVLNLFAGPGYNAGKFTNDSDEDAFDVKGGINGFGLRTGITLGFAF